MTEQPTPTPARFEVTPVDSTGLVDVYDMQRVEQVTGPWPAPWALAALDADDRAALVAALTDPADEVTDTRSDGESDGYDEALTEQGYSEGEQRLLKALAVYSNHDGVNYGDTLSLDSLPEVMDDLIADLMHLADKAKNDGQYEDEIADDDTGADIVYAAVDKAQGHYEEEVRDRADKVRREDTRMTTTLAPPVTPFGTRTCKLVHGTRDTVTLGKPVKTLCGKRATPDHQYGPGQWVTVFVQGVQTGHEGGTCNGCVKAYGVAPADVPEDVTAPDNAVVHCHKRPEDPHLLYAACKAADDADTWGHWTTGYASPALVSQWIEHHITRLHTPHIFGTTVTGT